MPNDLFALNVAGALPIDPDSIFSAPLPLPTPALPQEEEKCEAAPVACLKAPYPPARAKAKNERYANLIRSSFSGRDSELSAVMTYFFQSLKFSGCAPDLKRILMDIAICEMHHLELFGELLISLGVEPKFFCCMPPNANPGGWWVAHPSIIKYTANLGEALKFDIEGERAAVEEYKSMMNYVDDECISALLCRIAADEEEHVKMLTLLYTRYCS